VVKLTLQIPVIDQADIDLVIQSLPLHAGLGIIVLFAGNRDAGHFRAPLLCDALCKAAPATADFQHGAVGR